MKVKTRNFIPYYEVDDLNALSSRNVELNYVSDTTKKVINICGCNVLEMADDKANQQEFKGIES